MPLSASTLPRLTAAHKDLIRAFAPESTPHADFWRDVADRLLVLASPFLPPHLCPATIPAVSYPPRIPAPDFATTPKPADLKPRLAAFARQSIRSFVWSETPELNSYWRQVASILGVWAPNDLTFQRLDGTATDPMNISALEERAELRRLNLTPPDFVHAPWYVPGSFPHHDPADPALIKYRPKGRPAALAQFTSAKPGKYLTARYGHLLSAETIADLAARFRTSASPPALKLARTADEIAAVYRNGPSSCMGGKNITFGGHNPVTAYAVEDCAVAYFERDSRITARAVVRLSNKKHSKIYGDAAALLPLLKKEGFTSIFDRDGRCTPHGFDGLALRALKVTSKRPAKLAYEKANEPVLAVPYIDGISHAYYDPAQDALILCQDESKIPKDRFAHTTLGGYSCFCFPNPSTFATNLDRSYPTHFRVEYGGSGTIQTGTLSASDLGRAEELHAHIAATEAKQAAARQAQRDNQPKARDNTAAHGARPNPAYF